jgi:DNA-binding protein Fis
MKSAANARLLTPVEGQAGESPTRTSTLIKAALSLSQAIEALSRLNFVDELSLPDVENGISFYEQVSRFERALILEALRITRGRQREASALLGLKPTTLNSMLRRYGIDVEDYAAGCDVKRTRESRARSARRRPPAARGARGPVGLPPAPADADVETAGAKGKS